MNMVCSHCSTPRPIKMACTELCVGIHTTQKQTPTQIPIEFSTNYICICVSLGLGVKQCECIIKQWWKWRRCGGILVLSTCRVHIDPTWRHYLPWYVLCNGLSAVQVISPSRSASTHTDHQPIDTSLEGIQLEQLMNDLHNPYHGKHCRQVRSMIPSNILFVLVTA